MKAKDVEKALDEEGVAVRAGKLAAGLLLKAMGAGAAVRASFMFYNTREEADALAGVLEKVAGGVSRGFEGAWRAMVIRPQAPAQKGATARRAGRKPARRS